MSEEEQPGEKEYVITKYGDDGKEYQDIYIIKSLNRESQVQYTNEDTYHWDFKDGVQDEEGTYTYSETGNKYEGQ